MAAAQALSDEFLAIAEYLEKVGPNTPTTRADLGRSIDLERSDEFIVTANGQSW